MKKHIKPVKGKKQPPPKPTPKPKIETIPPPQKEISEEERVEKLLVEMNTLTLRFGQFVEQKKHRNAYVISIEIAQITEKIGGFYSNEAAAMYIQSANMALFIKEYAAAARLYKKVFTIIETIKPDPSIKMPDIYNGAAQTAEHLKNYDKAIYYNLKAIDCLKKKKWKDDEFMATLFIKVNDLYVQQKKYAPAILSVHKAINIQKKQTNINTAIIALYYQIIGSHYQTTNNINAALTNYKKSFELLETHPKEYNREKSTLCFSLGYCYLVKEKHLLYLEFNKKTLVFLKTEPSNSVITLDNCIRSFRNAYYLCLIKLPAETLKPYKKWFKTNFPTHKL